MYQPERYPLIQADLRLEVDDDPRARQIGEDNQGGRYEMWPVAICMVSLILLVFFVAVAFLPLPTAQL